MSCDTKQDQWSCICILHLIHILMWSKIAIWFCENVYLYDTFETYIIAKNFGFKKKKIQIQKKSEELSQQWNIKCHQPLDNAPPKLTYIGNFKHNLLFSNINNNYYST